MTIPYQTFSVALSVLGIVLWLVVLGITTIRLRSNRRVPRVAQLNSAAMVAGFLTVAVLTLIAALSLGAPAILEVPKTASASTPDSVPLGRLAVDFIRGIVVVVPAYMILVYWHFDHAAEGQRRGQDEHTEMVG